LDPELKEELVGIIEKLLADKTIVIFYSVYNYNDVIQDFSIIKKKIFLVYFVNTFQN
jgi:hypothetical protein